MKIKVKKCRDGAVIPQYATPGAACFDLCMCADPSKLNSEGDAVIIGTGLQFEIPEGHVMMVYSRSGHGFNYDIRLANCVGVVDSDFRGEVMVKLTQDSNVGDDIEWSHGDRIAQAMVIPVQQVQFDEVESLSATERGTGGFGSTGR